MSTVPPGPDTPVIVDSTRRLIAAVKKLEHSLSTAGLPRWMSRLPVWWLSWHYCRMLDQKIDRMRRIARKFELWLPAIRAADQHHLAQLEFIDTDHVMRDDIDVTRHTMWELRAYCIDIATMFDQLAYRSARLQQRQQLFLSVIEHACVQAATMQDALLAHDAQVLALLQARQQGAATVPAFTVTGGA
jgi:hypothetical protein